MQTTFDVTLRIKVSHDEGTFIDTNSVLGLAKDMESMVENSGRPICEVGEEGETMMPARSCLFVTLLKYWSSADGDLTEDIKNFED